MITFTAEDKENFLDRPRIMAKISEEESKAFNRIGGRIRVTAQRGQRKTPKKRKGAASPPGTPPFRHVQTGSGLTKIYYTYDSKQHRVTIAPVAFNWSAYGDVTVPEVNEFGKRVTIVEVDYSVSEQGWVTRAEPRWIRVGKRGQRNRGKRPMRTRTANYPARPFMLPALEKNQSYIRDQWSSAVASIG